MKLLDQLRNEIRLRHYSIRTEHSYADWVVRYVRFHNLRHPSEMGAPEINRFLTHLAVDGNVAASTQNQALCALVFLYTKVLKQDVGEFGEIVRAKRPARLPVVLTEGETERILSHLSGIHKLMALLMYGTGMRIIEVLRLRVKDIEFEQRAIIVRDGKGEKDRAVPLPQNTVEALQLQLAKVREIHAQDLLDGFGTVHLPYALERKYPNTNKLFHWKYVFPSPTLSVDPRSGIKQRHHVYESVLQGAIRAASRKAAIPKDVHSHTLRHSFASHLLASGTDIRTIQQLLGHKDVSTTMIYTHIMKTGPLGVVSPADRIKVEPADLSGRSPPLAAEVQRPPTEPVAIPTAPLDPRPARQPLAPHAASNPPAGWAAARDRVGVHFTQPIEPRGAQPFTRPIKPRGAQPFTRPRRLAGGLRRALFSLLTLLCPGLLATWKAWTTHGG